MSTITKKDVKEVIIEIDNTLEFKNPITLPWNFKAEGGSDEEALERYKKEQNASFNKAITNKSETSGLELVRDCIGGEVRHMGYLGYLEQCWRNHIGIIFTPDILWQIFLTEVSTHIKANAEKYKSLFTDSDEKKEIIVMTGDPQLIDLRLIADELLKLTPTNTEMFLPGLQQQPSSHQWHLRLPLLMQ